MKGVVVAAGEGKRLGGTCKALLKIDKKYLIEYPLQNMKELVEEVIIIHHGPEIQKALGDNYQGMKLTYVEQDERKGIAHAISLAKDVIGDDMFCVILGDIIYKGEDLPIMKVCFENSDLIGMPGFKLVQEEYREEIKKSYGFFEDRFIEKPTDLTGFSNFLGLGIYMFRKEFFGAIEKTKAVNGEVGITDALNQVTKIKPYLLQGVYQNINTKEELESYHG